VTHSPQIAFQHVGQWHVASKVQWCSWPLVSTALPKLLTQAKKWQGKYPEALIVGAISYEQAALHHNLPHQPTQGPAALLGLVQPEHWQTLPSLPAATSGFSLQQAFAPHLPKATFTARLNQLIECLAAGQQANLAQPFSAPYQGSTWQAWLTLMARHNAPHACYLEHPELALLSASPELLLQASHERLHAEPIKGSIPRGHSAAEDQALGQQLLNSPKDLAENRMITALQVDELKPLCQANTVAVEQDCELRVYSNVQHLVSTVSGTPRPGLHPLAALIACLPAASITGIPKQWATEAINKLEDEPRGFYCGSFFHLHPNGELVANVLIRTMQAQGGRLLCHGGGGITALSNSNDEYAESCFKVAPLFSVWDET